MYRVFCYFILIFSALNTNAWNSLGHQLVAQIAYDNLTPTARQLCDKYNRSFNLASSDTNFVTAATWLDQIRGNDIHWFDNLHYIDIPFSKDRTKLPPIREINALWGIKQATFVLSSNKSSLADKGLSLRILIHIIGDIHQPLHTTTRVSKRFPKGDLGGNLYLLKSNSVGRNLHQYWDNGAGVLIGKGKNKLDVKIKASQLQKKWSCKLANIKKKPEDWVKESHQIALKNVYTKSLKSPCKKYQAKAQEITQKQILFAGCRLAAFINQIV